MTKIEIRKVWLKKTGKYSQKLVCVPQSSDIKEGDYVKIIKMELKDDEE